MFDHKDSFQRLGTFPGNYFFPDKFNHRRFAMTIEKEDVTVSSFFNAQSESNLDMSCFSTVSPYTHPCFWVQKSVRCDAIR